jgi:hypothetical protein
MSTRPIRLVSLSAAMDGGFVGVADVADVMRRVGAADDYRLIGGLTVMLHVQRLGLELPLRATGDADFGVPPHLLRNGTLISKIEELGYRRTAGNRWERALDERRIAAVDLLVPAYTSRARDTVEIADVVTTEVPGLAIALQRPAVEVASELVLTDGSTRTTKLMLPDALSTLVMKAYARTVRSETRDAEDLWRALEICVREGVRPSDFQNDALRQIPGILWRDLDSNGPAMSILTNGLQAEPAARMRTRVKALLVDVVGAIQ